MTHDKAKEIAEKIKEKGIISFANGSNNDPTYQNAYLVGWLTSTLAYVLANSNIKEKDLEHLLPSS